MLIQKLASAIYNDIVSGLRGYHNIATMSLEQLEDEIVEERLAIIKEYTQKGVLPREELLTTINCIPIDCKDIENCQNCKQHSSFTPTMHFEIPQFMQLSYIGSPDKTNPFQIYLSPISLLSRKYRKRGLYKPYVLVDTTPNENGMNDCWIFNAPLLKSVSVIGIFKDPRQLEEYNDNDSDDNISSINSEIKKRLIEKKIRYYRQFAAPLKPNDQTPQ